LDRIEFIKQNLSIPKYFELMILPDMPDYYDGDYIDFDNRPVVKCPLHSENTASFRYFDDTDSFYCFGCTASGDVISLHRQHMLLNRGISTKFEQVEKELYELAINQGERVIKNTLKKEKHPKINNDQDLLRFNINMNRWLRRVRLMGDDEKRFGIINTINNYRDVVRGQGLLVSDAIKYINKIVRG